MSAPLIPTFARTADAKTLEGHISVNVTKVLLLVKMVNSALTEGKATVSGNWQAVSALRPLRIWFRYNII